MTIADDARPIYDAVDGFDFEVINYTHPNGTTDPCHTLVGTWEP